ncbi:hypothetical protein ACJ41O_005938 [Fusarium nematophilum]
MHKTFFWPRKSPHEDVRVADITEDLEEHSRRLFTTPYGQVEVAVAEVTSQVITNPIRPGTEESFLETEGELREHLSIYHPEAQSSPESAEEKDEPVELVKSCFFLLDPAYAWSDLPITRDGMLSLLSALDVFPAIYRFLTAFGRKNFPMDEGFAGFDSVTTLGSSGELASFESCYLLKYVGRKDDATPGTIPWSIRHALIYQKINESGQTSHILIRMPEKAKDQLASSIKEEGSDSRFAKDWTRLHAVSFSSVDGDLRHFINYLDEEVTKAFDRVIMSGIEPTKLNEFDSVERSTKDFKTLQYLSDQARRAINAIELNIDTIRCLQKEIGSLSTINSSGGANTRSIEALSAHLEIIQREYQFSLKNASAVLDRAKATSQHLRDTASLRNSEISKLNAEMANHNTRAIANLADKSGREAHVVKTLTVLALVFVPASFVAVWIFPFRIFTPIPR